MHGDLKGSILGNMNAISFILAQNESNKKRKEIKPDG